MAEALTDEIALAGTESAASWRPWSCAFVRSRTTSKWSAVPGVETPTPEDQSFCCVMVPPDPSVLRRLPT